MMSPSTPDIEASSFGKGSYLIEVGYANMYGMRWCFLISSNRSGITPNKL